MQKKEYLELYHQMVLIRRLEEKAAAYYQDDKIGGFYISISVRKRFQPG